MYYLKQSYYDQIIICNPNDEIIARLMYHDFKSTELAYEQAEQLVNLLNLLK